MDVRAKLIERVVLQPLEALIAEILRLHPEYDGLLADEEKVFSDEFLALNFPVNPFLHLGLHVALQEQLDANRPAGVVAIYQNLLMRGIGDDHHIKHLMMGCLSENLFRAQSLGTMPDELDYLECLKCLA